MITFEVELTYWYCELDKEPQFGIVFSAEKYHETYIRWVWFKMGEMFGGKPPRIYPYSLKDLGATDCRKYKYAKDATKQAKLLVDAIQRLSGLLKIKHWVETCTYCKKPMTLVRPGKFQCDNCY